MPAINLANGDYKRILGRTPRLRHVNVFVEPDPANPVTGNSIIGRPGLSPYMTVGPGPITMVWRQDGTFNGDYLIQSGPQLYRGTTLLGSLYPGLSRTAARQTDSITVDPSGVAFLCNGTALTTVAMPDGQMVQDVAAINSYYLLPVRNSQRIYFIEPGQTTVDPLNFFSAERTPDNVESVAILGDEVWFLGTAGVEVWTPSGDADAPFQRTAGRVYPYGCKSKNTVCVLEQAIYWVSDDNQVIRAQGTPAPVDNPAISEQIRMSSDFRAWTYRLDDHSFYVLSGADLTLAFDTSIPLWSHWHSYQSEGWRAHLGSQNGSQIVVGDRTTNKLWTLDVSRSNDDGDPIIREVTGQVANIGNPVQCNSMSLRLAAGWSASPSFEPRLEFRWSDDDGNTWSIWRTVGLGVQGQYNKDLVARSLGLIQRPGRLFTYRMSDDALFRMSYARVNDV